MFNDSNWLKIHIHRKRLKIFQLPATYEKRFIFVILLFKITAECEEKKWLLHAT